MNIEEKVQAVLAADAGVTAIITDPKNIRVPGNWSDIQPPYIIHRPVTVQPNRTHDGLVNLKTWRYQVDAFGAEYSLAKLLAVAIRNALGSYRAGNINSMWIGEGPYFYLQNLDVHQIAVEFEIADNL